ncbi:hypothetical protein [Stygiolobus sp. RP850M]|uniref:hypothetical protein n=1 Tax=Stygiolobus sp. RP850M TaxID=3133137 RepID=UPI00307DA8F9
MFIRGNRKFLKALALAVIFTSLFSLTLASSQIVLTVEKGANDYGYEFPTMQINGINSTVTYYYVNVTSQVPSTQENVYLIVNNTPILVQNVFWYYGPYGDQQWLSSIYYNGIYHMKSFSFPSKSKKYVLTTVWKYNGSGLLVTFTISNGTFSHQQVCYLPGTYGRVAATTYPGTVVAGYRNASTAYLGKGFNVSISTEYLYDGKWYVPPAIIDGFKNISDSAVYGKACLATGNKVFVVYNDIHGVMYYVGEDLALPSVIISGNKVLTFPFGSLWVIKYPNGSTSYFINETTFIQGAIVCPFGNITLPFLAVNPLFFHLTSFILNKTYYVTSNHLIYCEKQFWVPQPEYVFVLVNGIFEPILINESENIYVSNQSTTTLTTSSQGQITSDQTITSTVTITSTITSYVTIHVVTSVITYITTTVTNSAELYKGVIITIAIELIGYLLLRKK